MRVVWGAVLAGIGAIVAGAAEPPEPAFVLLDGHAAHPSRVLARMRPTPSADARAYAGALAALDVSVVRAFPLIPGLVVLDEAGAAARAPVPGNAAGSMAAPPLTPVQRAARAQHLRERLHALRGSGLFSYVEPDYIVTVDAAPVDERFADGTLWGLHNTGQNGGVAGFDVDALRAWEITTGSREVIVAVVDTGINYTHADLREQMWRNPGELPFNGIDDDGNGFSDDVFGLNAVVGSGDPRDDNNHGSHVAGTIGAAANDGHAHVGVAWQVQLMACKFLTADGWGYTADAVVCIDYATMHGARIINASWGGGDYSQGLVDAINAAGEHDVLFVAAAGNSALNLQSEIGERVPAYPAGYNLDAIIAVAAIDRTGALAPFSNFGRLSVDLGAPGVQIFSAFGGLGKYAYGTYQGTSMAAPHVAGVAALALSAHPELKVGELKNLLVSTATPTPSLQETTISGGRINAYGAVAAAPDQQLELALTMPTGQTLFAGHDFPVFAHVHDVHARPGATVTGTIAGQPGGLDFRDDGQPPDRAAGDGTYATWLKIPSAGEEIVLAVRADLPGFGGADATATLRTRAPPAHDIFATAVPLPGTLAFVATSNRGATKEAGEPAHAGKPGGASVWWTWTAPADCSVKIRTVGSYDTLLAVYTGDTVSSLSEVASNDNVAAPNQESTVVFPALAGTVYRIAVDAWDGVGADFSLELTTTLPPVNDDFAARTILAGPAPTIATAGTLSGATNEVGEPGEATPGGSVWWEWTAPADGTALLLLTEFGGGGGYGALDVFRIEGEGTLERLPSLAQFLYPVFNRYTFHAVAGARYALAVRGVNEQGGSAFTLEGKLVDAPPHDRFAERLELTGDALTFVADTAGATREPGEPAIGGVPNFSTSLWFTWTAPRSGTVTLHAVGEFQAAMAVYSGDSLATLEELAVGDHDPFLIFFRDLGTQVVFPAEAGRTYQFVIDAPEGFVGRDTVTLTMTDPPANDRIADRAYLTGAPLRVPATNRGAVAEPGEPMIHYLRKPLASVWWTWTVPRDGRAVVRVLDTTIVPYLRVFRGEIDSLAPVQAFAEEYGRLVFSASAGESYHLSVDGDPIGSYGYRPPGTAGVRGDFVLDLAVVDAPANDSFEDRIPIAGTNTTVTGSNLAARADGFDLGVQRSFAPLWWTWTAPANGKVTFSTAGSTFDTVLALFLGSNRSNVNLLTNNDDADRGTTTSTLTIQASAGTRYQIVVDGRRGATGDVQLSVAFAPPPANDAFATADLLVEGTAAVAASNLGATAELEEPNHGFVPAESSLWWNWTAPASGDVVIATIGSAIDTVLGVYTGPALEALTNVGFNDDIPGDTSSRVILTAQAGVSYRIAVDGFAGAMGPVELHLQPLAAPAVELAPPLQPPVLGDEFTLQATPAGLGPFTYQWQHDGVDLPGATNATLRLASLQRFHAGAYAVIVRNFAGTATSASWLLAPAPPPVSAARLLNLSTRGEAREATGPLISGFVISGPGNKRVLLRAVGPSLQLPPIGLAGSVLPDPELTLRRFDFGTHSYADVAISHDWIDQDDADEITAEAARLFAFTLQAPEEAALLLELPPGQYTATARDQSGGAGLALVELYDADESAESGAAHLVNISSRGFTGPGDAVLIPGFVISREGSKTILLRAVGPTLALHHGVNFAAADPRLTLYRAGDTTPLLAQDNWGENPDAAFTAATAAQVSAFPLAPGSADAAFVITLPPGVYTAVGAVTPQTPPGVILVEVYAVP